MREYSEMHQHVRIARATTRLAEIAAFYRDVLGFEGLASFVDHAGFDGVMLGRRGDTVHFEFTCEAGASPEAMPSPETLVVLYYEEADWEAVHRNANARRVPTVRSHNPYWDRHGITIVDPDGYRIVLHRGPWRP